MPFPGPVPVAPNSGNPATFNEDADVFLGWMNLFGNWLSDNLYPNMAVRPLIAGTAGAPVYSRDADTNTGMYFPAADQIGFSTGGSLRVTVSNTALTLAAGVAFMFPNGTAAAPVLAPASDTNTGIFFPAEDTVGVSAGGTQRVTITGSAITSAVALRGPNGTVTAPAYAPSGDTNTGLFFPAADVMAVAAGGVERLRFTTSAVASALPLTVPNGTEAAPSVRGAEANTGLYYGASLIGFSVAGSTVFSVGAGGITYNQQLLIPNGTPAAPSVSLSAGNTGFYSAAAGAISFSSAGAERLRMTSGQLLAPAGTVALPGFAFLTDTDSGVSQSAVGTLQLVVGATARVSLTTSSATFANVLLGPNGSTAAPAFSFSSDPNTGMYKYADDMIGFSTNGVPAMAITNNANIRLFNTEGTFYTEIVNQPTANRTLTLSASGNTVLVNGTMVPNSVTLTAGDGLTGGGNLSANRSFAVDDTVLRTTGAQTITGNKTITGVFLPTGSFDVNGSGAGGQSNGLYLADSGGESGTTLAPTNSLIIAAQTSTSRSIALSVTGSGYIYGFRSHSNAGTYTWQSRVREADSLVTARAITVGGTTKNWDASGALSFSLSEIGAAPAAGSTAITSIGDASATRVRAGNGSAAAPALSFSGDTDTGMYRIGADTLGFATAGVPGMALTSSGNLRLYNTGGTFYTEISNQPTANRVLTLSDGNTTLVAGTMVPTGRTITAGTGLTGGGDLSSNRTINVDTSEVVMVTAVQTISGIKTFSGGRTVFSNGSGASPSIVFGNSNTAGFFSPTAEHISVVSDGNVPMRWGGQRTFFGNHLHTNPVSLAQNGITVDSNSNFISVSSDTSAPLYLGRATTTGVVAQFRQAGTTTGSINVTASATAYNTSSDYRLKKDVKAVPQAVDRLMALKPVNFTWVNSPEEKIDGFLAHELAEVIPNAVTGSKDAVDAEGKPEYQAVDLSKVVPLLTAALQEALRKIATLEEKLDEYFNS